MRELLLATTNPAKLARLRWVVEGLPCEVSTPDDFPGLSPRVPEDGADFAANAAQKARAWSAAAEGMLALASDGGLDVPALGDRWVALRTRRNAGPAATNAGRIRHLLDLMRDLRGEERRAYWHEALALARDGTLLQYWTASGDGGLIVEEPPPGPLDDAFWNESIRYYPAAGKLYRDLSAEETERLDLVWPRLREEVRAYLAVAAW
jgi:XTP/dITP diphosphohydrolase